MEYHLFAADRKPELVLLNPRKTGAAQQRRSGRARKPDPTRFVCQWSDEIPLQVRTMVLADQTLFISGPQDVVDEEEAARRINDPEIQLKLAEQVAALEGKKGALLRAVSIADGKKVAEYKLQSLPVWDGMAACMNSKSH